MVMESKYRSKISRTIRDVETKQAKEAVDIEDIGSLTLEQRLNKKGILSVTDLSSQIWCEAQIINQVKYGRTPENRVMLEGTIRHEALELQDHDVVDVIISSREEGMAFRLLNAVKLVEQVIAKGVAREIWLTGYIGKDVRMGVRGVIDILELCSNSDHSMRKGLGRLIDISLATDPELIRKQMDGMSLLIADTKTRRSPTLPSQCQKLTSAIQLQTYHVLIASIQNSELTAGGICEMHNVEGQYTVDHPDIDRKYQGMSLLDIAKLFLLAYKCLPPLLPHAEVVYDHKIEVLHVDEVPCNDQITKNIHQDLLFLWTSNNPIPERLPTHEKWKCKYCYYLPNCEYTQLEGTEKEDAIATVIKKTDDDKTELEEFKKELQNSASIPVTVVASGDNTLVTPTSDYADIKPQPDSITYTNDVGEVRQDTNQPKMRKSSFHRKRKQLNFTPKHMTLTPLGESSPKRSIKSID